MNLKKFLIAFMMLTSCALSFAGVADDADAALAHWAAAYTSNNVDDIVGSYWADAVLLGTVSPVMSEGESAIRKYFSPVVNSGNRNAIGERRMIVINDSMVLITGFYEFTRMKNGVASLGPSRFTMLMEKRGSVWRIRHHHSSPHVQPVTPP